MFKKYMRETLAALALACIAGTASAQSETVRIVVAFPPGGPSDTLARLVAHELGPILDANVVVENKPGGNGALAAGEVARAKPDGNTVFLSSAGAIAINPGLYEKLTYDPAKDFVPVTMLIATPEILAVSPKNGLHDFTDFKQRASEGKDGVALSSSGIGSMPHMAIALLKRSTGFNILHVPYSGAAPAIKDSIGGQVDGFFGDISGLLKYVQDGRLAAVGVAATKRSPALPDVPTFQELGYQDVIATNWYGVFAPAGTPREAIDRLNAACNKAMQTDAAKKYVRMAGVDTFETTPEAFADMVKQDTRKWGDLVKEEHITVNG